VQKEERRQLGRVSVVVVVPLGQGVGRELLLAQRVPQLEPLLGVVAPIIGLAAVVERGSRKDLRKKINRSHTHTHTDRKQHPRQRHTHTHTTRTTPQKNTSHKHLTTLEGGATRR